MQKGLKQANILNVLVNSTSKEEVLTLVTKKISEKAKFIIFTPNPEIILAAQSDPDLASILNSADLSIPDGVGLKLVIPTLTIIKGRQLMVDLLKLAEKNRLKVFFLGASPSVNKESVEKTIRMYPHIRVKGDSGPYLDRQGNPQSDKDMEIEKKVISNINSFQPNFLFVAFGTPKEQKWIAKNFKSLKLNCVMEIGGSLDYFSEQVKLPPVFMTALNLEWLWRLLHDPRRIGRIFNALILFPIKVILSRIKL